MNQVIRLVIAVAGCVLLAVGTAGPAVAHATLVRSNPAEGAVLAAAPAKAVFVFDEAVSLPDQGVKVFDAEGDNVAASATSQDTVVTVDLPDRMASGTYVVTWRAVSGDGHPIAGSLSFSIGRPSVTVAAPEPADAESPKVSATLSAVQGVGYLGLFLAAGITVFASMLLPRTIAAGRSRARIQGLAKTSAVVALVATALTIPLTVIHQQGLGLGRVADRDTWLAGSPSAMAALVLLAVGFTLLGQNVGAATDRRTRWFALSGVALVVIAPALTGHTRAFSPEPLVVGTDILHVLAGSVWLGGLVGIALTLPALAGREDDAAQTLARFSMAAAGVLVALAGTGLVLAWRILASWENLVGSTYGRILLVKVAVVLIVTAVAGWNRFVLLPGVRAAKRRPGRKSPASRISGTVRIEAALLVVVLLLTGFLVNKSPRAAPASAAEGRSGVQTAALGDLEVRATMTPGVRGRNTIRFRIQDSAGAPVALARLPTVSIRSDDLDLGTVPVTRAGAGTCTADVVIPAAGRVEVQVGMRRSRFENPVATLTFRIPSS
ncbi:copper resistance protein CopC [Nocardioides sp. NPDC127503]|uniref:copper resistance CopC/CopD family protein n=1 Tax=Nocardioides sp. NPDC127503 TaxID=3154516 RepID=UPI0033307795